MDQDPAPRGADQPGPAGAVPVEGHHQASAAGAATEQRRIVGIITTLQRTTNCGRTRAICQVILDRILGDA